MPAPTEPDVPPVDLAVVVTQDLVGDLAGALLAPTGEVLFSHVSSSIGWLQSDLTNNFGRRDKLDAKYPQGWTVSVYYRDPAPAELIAANAAFYETKGSDGEATA
jgi:hypothetical protein